MFTAKIETKPTSSDNLVFPNRWLDPIFVKVSSEMGNVGDEEGLPLHGMESLSTASKISAQSNIVQDVVMAVQSRIHKTNRALSNCSSLFIDLKFMLAFGSLVGRKITYQSQNSSEQWRGQTGSVKME